MGYTCAAHAHEHPVHVCMEYIDNTVVLLANHGCRKRHNRRATNKKYISRRDILKKSAVGAGAGLGLTKPALAWEAAKPSDLKQLKTSPKVQSILTELGHEKIPQEAEKAEFTIGESNKYSATRVDLGYGTLMFGNFTGETSAGFEFADENRSQIKSSKYQNIPIGVDAWLLGKTDNAIFMRTATEQERDSILSSIPVDESDEPSIYTGSEISGFYVDVMEIPDGLEDDLQAIDDAQHQSEELEDALEALEDAQRRRYHIGLEGKQTIEPMTATSRISRSDTKIRVNDITTRGIIDDIKDLFGDVGAVVNDCGNTILGCVATIGASILGCSRCGPICTTAGTGVGAVLCFGCVYLFCDYLLTAIACVGPGGAVACLANNGYI